MSMGSKKEVTEKQFSGSCAKVSNYLKNGYRSMWERRMTEGRGRSTTFFNLQLAFAEIAL